jgi:hypothetical protein
MELNQIYIYYLIEFLYVFMAGCKIINLFFFIFIYIFCFIIEMIPATSSLNNDKQLQ